MRLIDKATNHFEGLKNSSIDVPEWETTVYFDPPTLAQRQSWMGMKEARAQATVLIKCAKDAEGNPLFEDTPEVMAALQSKVAPHTIARIVRAILGEADTAEMGNA